jgi:electron transfer flavoprotein alpha subunit
MRVLVVAEHDANTVRLCSRSAIGFAKSLTDQIGGSVECLLLGHQLNAVASSASALAPVLTADSAALAVPVADRYAQVINDVARARRVDLVAAASTTFAKDILARAAGLLGGAMASDVVGHRFADGRLLLRRPMYAGAVLATVALSGQPQIVTIRSSAYAPAQPSDTRFEVTALTVDEASLPNHIQHERIESRATGRPDLTEARVVVSGGRTFKNIEEFEHFVGRLADKLGGATGCTRALVDAGITPNELQVGQTGKIVAPELYIALGISGAIQHIAGMKNSKVIVAINSDPEAPIFELADYGLVGDVRELVPQMLEKLNGES